MMKYPSLFSLKDSIVVLTGACGQLGQNFVGALCDSGAAVAGLDIVQPRNPIFSEYQAKGVFRFYQVDITSRQSLEMCLGEIRRDFGSPNGLINNAAIDSPPNASIAENGPFENYPETSLDKMIDVNIKGTFFACQVFGGEMARQKGGSVINISSIYGLLSPNQGIYEYRRKKGEEWFKPVGYSLTKSAILNLTRYLATYWAKSGVRVNTLTPAGIFNRQDREFLENYLEHLPIGRMAEANELNGSIIFLLSHASSYMTGHNMIVDGGWTAW